MKKETSSADDRALKLIRGLTLESRKNFSKANENAVIGKVLGAKPELKKDIKNLMKEISKTVKEYNKLPEKEFLRLYDEHEKYLPKKEKKDGQKTLPELKKVPGPYAFRMEPSPTGPLHLGHIIVLLLNAGYAKKYNGRLIVRIADTNPEDIYAPAYDMIPDEAEWITQQKIFSMTQSSRMDDYYLHAATLIEQGNAYVCTCSPENFKQLVDKKQACTCRSLSIKEQKERWQKMFDGYEMGEAVLRIKTDVKHKNPAVREWPAFRINDAPHPRTGNEYRVWPLMNFSVAVDDHDSGITHVIRGKDHIVNMERQAYVFKYLNWDIPEYIHIGRINFTGLRMSTSGFREAIQNKVFSGWDDPRLPTLAAFRRRGFNPGAFMRYVTELGPSKVDKVVNYEDFIKAIYSYNRTLIDKQTHRYFFVESPKEITIADAPNLNAEVPIHPDVPAHGARHFSTAGKFYVEDELEKGKFYRFMHLFNFKDKRFHSIEMKQELNARLIHWLPVSNDVVNVEVKMPDGSTKRGIAEHTIKQAKIGDVIQFERKFFCRLDKIENGTCVFYYTHP